MKNQILKTLRPLSIALAVAASLAPLTTYAVSATWNATPTNGNWEAVAGENNWSTGDGTFPGALNALTNADIATFLTSNTTTIAINSTAGNASPLGIRGISFGVSGSTPDSFTIGSAGANGGNSLLLGSSGTIQIVSGATGTTTQTVNAPLVLEPATATTAGVYQFVNAGGNTNSLAINGNISGGTTTAGITLTLSGTSTSAGNVISGVISNGAAAGTLGLVKANSGTFAITGTNNSFTGALQVNQGVLNVATISNAGTNSSIGAGSGIFAFTASGGTGTLRINGTGGTTDRAITIVRSGASTGSGLIIDSSGSAPVTFSGGISSSATAAVSTTSFNTLTLAGSNTGANTISGSITDFNITAGNERLVAVTKGNNTATWVLSGTGSNYTGPTTISGGPLAGIGANAFGNTSGISIAGAGVLSLRGDASTSFAKASGGAYAVTTTAGGATINADQATVAGTGAKTMTIGTLGTSSTAATYQLNFTGANNTSLSVGAVTGPVSTGATNATVTIANAIAGGGSLALASFTGSNNGVGEILTFNGVGNTTVTGPITPSAQPLRLTQSGTGTTTINGTSTYTGITTVTAGSLIVGTGGIGSITSAINVTAGVIGGSGSTTGAVTVGNGAGGFDSFIAPGNSPGTFTTTSTLSLLSDATYSFELNSTSGIADRIVANGVSINAAAQFSFADLGNGSGVTNGQTFLIIDNTAGTAISNPFANLADGGVITSNGVTYTASYTGGTGNDLVLTAAVPEPSTYAMILAGAGLLFTVQRRRRSL